VKPADSPDHSRLPQSHTLRAVAAGAAALLCIGWAVYALSQPDSPGAHNQPGSSGLQLPRPPSLMGAGGHNTDAAQSTEATQAIELELPNSLANTQPDGDWSIGPSGQPQPSIALRRRFDYFLLLQGEQDLSALAAQIRQQIQAAHGAAGAQAIMALWASYLQLQQRSWTTQVNMQRSETWAPALAERSAMRRQLLGAAWAEAFYGDEERALRQTIAQTNSGLPVTLATQPSDPIALPSAAERLAEHQAQWQQWEQRISAARSRVQQLRSAPELSEPQRNETVANYLSQQFSGNELTRARALLGM
jgi:lipase chaperone LimK